MKKRILCFGDSNTFGSNPSGGRHDENTRWPMRLQQLLGAEYTIIEEGFGGRTCVFDDPVEGGYKSGVQYLPPCLMSHNPLDLVIIMLGTNDAKRRFQMSARTIAEAQMQLVRQCRLYGMGPDGAPPKVLILAPPPLGAHIADTLYGDIFGPDAVAVTRGFAAEFQRISRLMRCEYLNAGDYVEASKADAVHLTAEAHLRLAEAVCEKVRRIL